MNLIEYNVFRRDTRSASGKAKYDASDVLEGMGFRQLYSPSDMRLIRVLQQTAAVLGVPRDSIVAVQYPGHVDTFYRALRARGVKMVAIVHDINSLRDLKKGDSESAVLSLFTCLISHNEAMTSSVREMGYTGPIIELGLFDYLTSCDAVNQDRSPNTVAFAGNLSKAGFLPSLPEIRGVSFNLYGAPAPDDLPPNGNIRYRGSFPSEEIASRIAGAWGLVWDGGSIDSCAGPLGNYLRYNCPHKASMYVVAKRPLIVWEQAAIAPIVKREGIGIAVSSLRNLSEALDAVDEDAYRVMLDNVDRVRGSLVKGEHLRSAMGKALKLLGGK